MRFAVDTRIPLPLARVYPVYRDHFGAVAVDVENVHRVEVSNVVVHEQGLRHHHRWHGRVNLPLPARRYLSDEMLVWDAEVDWHDASTSCRWVITPLYFAEHVTCRGIVAFKADGSGVTRAVMEGELVVDLTGIRFIPHRLHAMMARRIEAFIGARIPLNFTGVGRNVESFLRPKAERSVAPVAVPVRG